MARLSPTSSRSTPQLSKILANGKSYAVSIVIGWCAAFMRARSGTRTFSCVIFSLTRFGCSLLKKIGAAAHRQPRIRAISKERALESLGVPVLIGSRREQTTNVLSTPSRREQSSTDQFNYIEKADGLAKERIGVAPRTLT